MRYEKGQSDNRKKKVGFIGVSRATLRALYGDNCYLCGNVMLFNPRDNGSGQYATMEHIVPRAKGGQKTWSNIKLACRDCNNDKRHLDLDEYLAMKEERDGE